MAELIAMLSNLVKLVTVVLAPIVFFFALAAWHSKRSKLASEYCGLFWDIVIAALMLGAAEFLAFYGAAESNALASLLSSILLLAVMVQFLLLIRSRVREHAHRVLKKKNWQKKGKASR